MNYFTIFIKRWKLVFLFIVLALMISSGLSLLQPFQYEAKTRLLVIQKESGDWDALAASRAAQTLSMTLSEVVYTNSFFDKVLNCGLNIQHDYGTEPAKRLKEWQNNLKTQVSQDTAIITIRVYDKSPAEARIIISAIAYVLETEGSEYHGGGQNVVIKTVDSPLVSNHPARPNLPFNLAMAFGLGLLFGLAFIFLINPEKHYHGLW